MITSAYLKGLSLSLFFKYHRKVSIEEFSLSGFETYQCIFLTNDLSEEDIGNCHKTINAYWDDD